MFQRNNPTAPPSSNEPVRPEELPFEIDPLKAPFFRIRQQVDGAWLEVGFVWTAGLSRTNGFENWYLYDSAREGDRERSKYTWPGFDASGRNNGTQLVLEPAPPFPNQTVSTLRSFLETNYGVTLTHVKASISEGR